ncbi:MAG: hypothetical protein ACREOQ_18500 [Gemmatimonadales bacterium]
MRSLPRAGAAMLLATLLAGCGADSTPTGATGEEAPSSRPLPSLTGAPVIGVSPTRLTFVMYAFRPSYEPPKQTLRITNLGGRTLTWTARDSGYWLKEGPASGTAPTTLTVRASRAAIPIGMNGYRPRSLQAATTISAVGASNTPVTVPVLVIISYQR